MPDLIISQYEVPVGDAASLTVGASKKAQPNPDGTIGTVTVWSANITVFGSSAPTPGDAVAQLVSQLQNILAVLTAPTV